MTMERTREGTTCGRDSRAQAGKINEVQREIGLGALPWLPLHEFACTLGSLFTHAVFTHEYDTHATLAQLRDW